MLPVSRILFLSCLIAMSNVYAQTEHSIEPKIPLKKPEPPIPAPPPAMMIKPIPAPPPAGSAPPSLIKKPFRVCSETQTPANDNCVQLEPTAAGTIRGHTDDADE